MGIQIEIFRVKRLEGGVDFRCEDALMTEAAQGGVKTAEAREQVDELHAANFRDQ